MTNNTHIRFAVRDDVPLILEFIEGLADYEKLRHECVATEALLEETLFGERPGAEVLLAFREGEPGRAPERIPVGFALFFHSYSTFLARPGIWLEDLFVIPEARGQGHGKALLARLADLAVERRCGRLEWAVLNWNTPAIDFYESIGAVAQDEWTTYRVSRDALDRLSKM
ncbi:MAG: N-acetyltransferase [Bacteroidetes bacterium CG12_big_fil_rev_8_21_14_0_65_60_17]|nr:MAG: N-acetyltransferase [Bacteroidetes bacterium CG12_big_fil_rev_8_21_14_0_65_60_17]